MHIPLGMYLETSFAVVEGASPPKLQKQICYTFNMKSVATIVRIFHFNRVHRIIFPNNVLVPPLPSLLMQLR